MPAKLVISVAGQADSDYPIQFPVVRVGDARDCEVAIPDCGLGSRELTIEYRGGRYFAYNRSDHSVVAGGKPIEPGKSAALTNGCRIGLNQQVEVKLVIDGDPAPSVNDLPAAAPRFTSDSFDIPREPEVGDPVDGPRAQASPGAGTSKLSMQLTILVFCVVGIGVVLLMRPSESTPAKPPPDLNDLMVLAADGPQNALCKELQQAELTRVRGDTERAYQQFSRLRDSLFKEKSFSAPVEPNDFNEMCLQFVELRLRALAIHQ